MINFEFFGVGVDHVVNIAKVPIEFVLHIIQLLGNFFLALGNDAPSMELFLELFELSFSFCHVNNRFALHMDFMEQQIVSGLRQRKLLKELFHIIVSILAIVIAWVIFGQVFALLKIKVNYCQSWELFAFKQRQQFIVEVSYDSILS